MSFGAGAKALWPTSGVAVAILLLFSVSVMVGVWRKHPEERFRITGLFFFLGALGSLALGLGWGRSGLGPEYCFELRYTVFMLPVLFCVYFIGGLYNTTTSGRSVQFGLFITMCVLWHGNSEEGTTFAEKPVSKQEEFLTDLRAGMPTTLLAERYTSSLNPSWSGEVHPEDKEVLVTGMRLLRRAGVGVFKQLQDDPACREIAVDLEPSDTQDIDWEDGVGHGYGSDPSLTFTLKKPQRVHALRLQCSLNYGNDEPAPASAQLSWKRSDQEDFPETEQNIPLELDTAPGETTVSVWINDTIDEFRIRPDNKPCVFRIAKIVLLVPATEE
jgi:hypothetical protein